MYVKNRSGQFWYFSMVSALSGNAVTGIASGNISGRVCVDGGAQAVIAGPVIEDGGGQYHANLFAADVNGNNLGFFASASGCVPAGVTAITAANVSGNIFLGSGSITSGMIASGIVFPTSGAFVNVPVASISGVFPASGSLSGQQVSVFSGSLSGQQVNLTSGQSFLASGGCFLGSGSIVSGLIASGIVFIASGPFVKVPVATLSGIFLASGSLSGQVVDLTSGQSFLASGGTYLASGSVTSGVISSGVFVTATASVVSGSVYLASGHFLFGSGQYYLASGSAILPSGGNVSVFSGSLSGQLVNLLSGNSVSVWSGTGVNVFSGTDFLPSGSLSKNTFASGMLSVEVPYGMFKADMSGVTGEAQRSLLNATRKLINKFDAGGTNSGKLTVFKEDDTTQAYTQNITATSGASPITSLDTN